MRRVVAGAAVCVVLAWGGGTAWAHPGALDKDGCHHDNATDTHHCHRTPSTMAPTTAPPTTRPPVTQAQRQVTRAPVTTAPRARAASAATVATTSTSTSTSTTTSTTTTTVPPLVLDTAPASASNDSPTQTVVTYVGLSLLAYLAVQLVGYVRRRLA